MTFSVPQISDGVWLAFGMAGQAVFSVRWITQWLISEKKRRSVVPVNFWYLSLIGGVMVLIYGIHRADPVIVIGQFSVFVYARNIFLLRRELGSATPIVHTDR